MSNITTLLGQIFVKPDALPSANADQPAIANMLHLALAVAGAIAMLIIVIAGLQYILSQGDPQKTAKAKDAILYAVIGLVITMVAYGIVSLVVRAVG